jgi:trk system potassium uptake protein TrkH
MSRAAGFLRAFGARLVAVVVFFASLVPILLEGGGVPLPEGALPWVRWGNVFFAGLLAWLEWRRFRDEEYRLRFLKEEVVDYVLVGAVLLVALEEWITGGMLLGLDTAEEAFVVPSKAYILANLVLRVVRLFRLVGKARWDYSKVFLGSFLAVISVGTLLLWAFPGSVRPGEKATLLESLFTSVSAVCVTGLAVVDTGTHWSRFGQIVILLLIQIGGLGLMTFAAFFAMALGKSIGFTDRMMLRDMLNVDPLHSLGRILAGVVTVTFACEAAGALVMYGKFTDPVHPEQVLPPPDQVFYAVFHSVSAFCNAGFSLYASNWMRFGADATMSVSVMALVVLGGLGFTVLLNLLGLSRALVHGIRRRLRRRPLTEEEEIEEERREPPRISLQTKVALGASALLVFGGAALVWAFERGNTLEGMDGPSALLASLFQSVTTRTAGFNTLDTARLQPVTLYLMMLLMFVGASPGGTGGGIKTVTAAVLLRSVTSLARGRRHLEMHRRSLPPEVASQAIVVVTLSFLAVFLGSLLLTVTEAPYLLDPGGRASSPFLALLFECTSAFGTVGLSAGQTGGLTASLSPAGQCILMLLMFLGRVGPLSLVVAMGRRDPSSYQFPEERVMIG